MPDFGLCFERMFILGIGEELFKPGYMFDSFVPEILVDSVEVNLNQASFEFEKGACPIQQ
jgi:hypothetical protein